MEETQLKAPIADKEDFIIETHGDKRNDPYFWMRLTDEQKRAETPDSQTQRVLNYLHAENEYREAIMQHTESFQEKLYDEMVGRIKKTDESVPYFKNGYWYYTKFEEESEYAIYCRKKGSMEAEEEIMVDANKLAEGHEFYQIGGLNVSPDNKLLAISEDLLSRRVYTIRFLNLETGEFLDDSIPNTTGGGAWANDNQTFFYTTKNEVTLLSEKIKKHKLGQDSANDALVYEEKDTSFYIGVYRSKSGKFITIYNSSTLVSDYYILHADEPDGEFQQFTSRGTDHKYQIAHFEDKFYIVTNWDAKNFRLMETPDTETEQSNWKEVLGHRSDVLLSSVDVFKKYLVISERANALTHIRVINQETKAEHYLDFGEEVYVAHTGTNYEFDTEVLRYAYSSLTTPTSTLDYQMDTREKTLKKQQEVVGGHEPSDYHTERVFATAQDGTQLPMSVVYRKGFVKDGNAPVLLYAYGSYGHTIDPVFSSTRLSLLDRGFAFAIAHIRGSQAMGRQWYEDGKLLKKKNTFTDYVDCAKHLIAEKFTSPQHLYAQGGSAGGLLMGAVVNLAPELFNGVIAAVPFVDVVSTMLDESIPLTTNEFDEWGNPKKEEYYHYIKSYSPYDNVEAKAYPNLLVTTGLFDSQVQYWEPAKWVAKLRDLKTDENQLLLYTNMDAGHGGASGRFKRYKEIAMEYAFFLDLEGIKA
ncbi:MAG: S9 family peptidase [Flammeovirgaceae bacterium]